MGMAMESLKIRKQEGKLKEKNNVQGPLDNYIKKGKFIEEGISESKLRTIFLQGRLCG